MTVHLRLFGAVGLTDSDGRDVQAVLAQPKRLALLVYLAAAHPAGFHRRDTLLALFWPDADEAGARAALSRAVHYLRQALGADTIVSRGDQELAIDRARFRSDLFEVTEALGHGDAAAALALYQGDFLRGFHVDGIPAFDSWLEGVRQQIRTAVAKGAGDASRLAQRSGDLAAAVSLARQACELAPYNEAAVLDLMRLLETQGNRSDALLVHEAFVRRFRDDLEASPGPELQAAADRIRRGRPAPPGPPQLPSPTRSPRPSRSEGRFAAPRGGGSAEPALRLVAEEEGEEEAPVAEELAPAQPREGARPQRGWLAQLSWPQAVLSVLVTVVVLGIAWALVGRSVTPLTPIVRFSLTIPTQIPPTIFGSAIALSPDGKNLVYVGRGRIRSQLFLRALDQTAARPLAGTEDGQAPFFSPDGHWVGYWGRGRLWKVPVEGGQSTPLADIWWVGGVTWLTDDVIVIGRTPGENRLSQVSAAGGAPHPLAVPPGASPVALPGGKLFLFRGEGRTISLAALADSTATPLGVFGQPVGVLDRSVIYLRPDGALMALPVDLARRRVTGASVPLLNGIPVLSAAVAANGTLVYIRRSTAHRIMLVDLSGQATPLVPEPHDVSFPAVSPDGRQVAFTVPSGAGTDISVYDLPSKTMRRLTSNNVERAAWTADGTRLGFVGSGEAAAYWSAADGSGTMDTLAGLISAKDGGIREVTFSPDGRFAVLRNDGWDTKRDLWLLPIEARRSPGRPVPLEQTPFDELMPRVSPDSRHLAFIGDPSGEPEVYVRPFPGSGQKLQVSDGGGTEPVWAPDGRGLFYRANGKVMLATLSATVPLRVLDRKVLFEDRYLANAVRPQYDVMPDGRRLLMLEPIRPDDQEGQAVFVVLGWMRELRQQLRPPK